MVSRRTIEKMRNAIDRKMPEIQKQALFANEGEQRSNAVRLAYRSSDDTLLVERVQEGSRTDITDKMNGIDLSFYIQGETLYDVIDPSSTLPYDEQWEEAMESGDYADSLDSEIAEGIDELYKEYGLTKSEKDGYTVDMPNRCPDGYHWVSEHVRRGQEYYNSGGYVKGHCAKNPSGTRTLYTEGEYGRYKWEVPKGKTFTDMKM